MSLRLPAGSSHSLGLEPNGVVRRVEEFLGNEKNGAGYLLAQADSVTHVLFLLQGKTFCAGSFQNDRFEALAIARFFAELSRARRVELCTTDLPLFLCTAVMFRKAPAAQIPLQLVDSAKLLGHIQQMGKDAVLVVRRGDARNVVFCREGKPQALYPAQGEHFPEGDSVDDRIIEYIYSGGAGDELVLDLYDEIRLPPAPDAGHSLKSYREPSAIPLGPQPLLVVQLGERVVFRYPILGAELSVGRGGGNDLALDNLSVSRRHARIRQNGETVVVDDQGSENGLVVAGKKVDRVELAVGDEVLIGKYTVRYEELAPGEVAEVPQAAAATVPAIDETIAVTSHSTMAELAGNGRCIRISGLMFNIGKKSDSHLRIKGFFVAG